MNELKNLIEKQIKLGAIMPGGIKEQYSVCGKTGCACIDKINPRRHGPYNQLSFSTKGKSSTMFITPPDLETAREMTIAYKEKRSLTQEIGLATIALCRQKGIPEGKRIYNDLYERALKKYLGEKPKSRNVKEITLSRDNWKEKAIKRQKELVTKDVKINNLSNSRDNWKEKCQQEKAENRIAQDGIKTLTRQLKEQEAQISEQKKKNS